MRFDMAYVELPGETPGDTPPGGVGAITLGCSIPILALAWVVAVVHVERGCRPSIFFPNWMCA